VALWVPESHGDRTRRFDPLGVLLSAAGLVAMTYGIIEAGARGWGDARSLSTIAGGLLLLVVFVLWQRRAQAPLVDLALFRSRGFTWGSILATFASFGMLGLLFSLPQFFQAVGGQDALGTGLRLLPIIGGMLIGARLADRLVGRIGAKLVVTLGLVLMGVGLLVGASTSVTSGYGFVGTWLTVAGLGLGFTMPPAMNAALSALSVERSGVGSGLLQALRQVGGAVGVAVLGTVLNSGYRDALPAGVGEGVRDSASAGVAVATRTGDAGLLDSVRSAFTHGMDHSLLTAGVIALVGAVLALLYLPVRPERPPVTGSPIPVSPLPAAESVV